MVQNFNLIFLGNENWQGFVNRKVDMIFLGTKLLGLPGRWSSFGERLAVDHWEAIAHWRWGMVRSGLSQWPWEWRGKAWFERPLVNREKIPPFSHCIFFMHSRDVNLPHWTWSCQPKLDLHKHLCLTKPSGSKSSLHWVFPKKMSNCCSYKTNPPPTHMCFCDSLRCWRKMKTVASVGFLRKCQTQNIQPCSPSDSTCLWFSVRGTFRNDTLLSVENLFTHEKHITFGSRQTWICNNCVALDKLLNFLLDSFVKWQ